MRAMDALVGLVEKIRHFASGPRTEQLACGDCHRWERCGLKPSAQCVARAAQIENEQGRPPKRDHFSTW